MLDCPLAGNHIRWAARKKVAKEDGEKIRDEPTSRHRPPANTSSG